MSTRIIVANWKMQFSFNNAVTFIQENANQLSECAQEKNCCVILCPSFETLSVIRTIIEPYPALALGAQDCSAHEKGPYTGQVCALSLAQIGCRYCIIGHSECRSAGQTNAAIASKAVQLVQQGIIPIVCIGETYEEYANNMTYDALLIQLSSIIEVFSSLSVGNTIPFYIAYEPVWAIGTGKVPDGAYLTDVFAWLNDFVSKTGGLPYYLLYGGSVTSDTAKALWDIPNNNGLLVGNASLDFQKFKNIVSWCG